MTQSNCSEQGSMNIEDFSTNPPPGLHFPTCNASSRPYVGKTFDTELEGIEFYKFYAKECGFEVRLGTTSKSKDGTIRIRYVLCNRQGIWEDADEQLYDPETAKSKKRKTTSCKADCDAKAILQITTGGRYYIRVFIEGHTHSMVPGPSRHLMPSNRNVGEFPQMLIESGIKANIGPMRTFRIYREIVGNYDELGCTSDDFKNYVRDLKVYSKDSDAHMLLEAFSNKQELGGFKFFIDLDEEKKLQRLIWTDEHAVKNYKLFGEAISFDATYCTNRYKLIFTPFTGRDNHGKCISFGAALISREDMDSYSWVLEKFVELMGHAPRVLITDQDPGLKKAIAASWKDTRHRFCMWHINIKVAEKLPMRLREDVEFKLKYDKFVWTDNDDPEVFEENWRDMIEEYDLASNKWFSDMYEDRMYWIPAYFRDVSMSGLFRTTSLSESENSFFKRFLNENSDLVLLYTNYCSALDSQRHNYQKITLADETRSPRMRTPLKLEEHASKIYTNTVFKEVQQEIQSSMFGCDIRKIYSEGEDKIFVVDDNLDGEFLVRHIHAQDYLSCGCNLFIRKGTLCKHMFVVLKNLKFEKIPHKYIVKRWCKFSIICPDEELGKQFSSCSQSAPSGDFRFFKVVGEMIGCVKGDEDLSDQLYSSLVELRDKFAKLGCSDISSSSKERRFFQFYGSAPSETPTILPPDVVKTKGSGAGGRRKSEQEKAMLLAQKPLRLCRKCNTKGHHDSRNCPTKESSNP